MHGASLTGEAQLGPDHRPSWTRLKLLAPSAESRFAITAKKSPHRFSNSVVMNILIIAATRGAVCQERLSADGGRADLGRLCTSGQLVGGRTKHSLVHMAVLVSQNGRKTSRHWTIPHFPQCEVPGGCERRRGHPVHVIFVLLPICGSAFNELNVCAPPSSSICSRRNC